MRHSVPLHAVLFAGVGSHLDARLGDVLAAIAPVERVGALDDAGAVIKRQPVGVIVTEIPAGKSGMTQLRAFANTGPRVPLVAIDGEERVTLVEPLEEVTASARQTRCAWEELPERIKGLLQLAGLRLEATLPREILECVADNVREGGSVVDRGMVVTRVNPAAMNACRFVGVVLGHSMLEQKRGCIPEIALVLQRVIATMKAELNVHLRCAIPGEEKTEIHLTATPLMDSVGCCHGAVAVILERASLAAVPEESRNKRRTFHRLIGVSERMQEVYDLIESLANKDTTTLITGESGVGKELVAEALHFKGRRGHGPLVKVNCAALQDNLLESELFGHVKGAFTGAVRDRPGRFEVASGGTIFLDEIGDISMSMQTRLLRVLQERELQRVGDSRTIKVDVRVIAATNRVLEEQIRLGRFREDLYFRLNVVEINVPPLRKRLEDIPLLVNHFIQKFNQKYEKGVVGVQDGVLELFLQYPWPGNIREMENAVEHAFVVGGVNTIRVKHLPKNLVLQRPCADPEVVEAEAENTCCLPSAPVIPAPASSEKESLLRTLEEAQWKKKKAAKLLGMSRSTLYRKLEKYGIR